MSRLLLAAAVAAAAVPAAGCLTTRYLAQAGYGQLDLLARARPIEEVIADPDVPPLHRALLAELPAIKQYARDAGLDVTSNYRTYVDLGRDYVVYFVGAAPRLSLTSRTWCFPIAGCFTGLGWFDEDAAVAHREELEREGWDAMARPASAYSTGGWFPDPLLSTMLPDGDPGTPDEATGFADLANVFFHESVHATVFVPDQPYFNEGLAEYLGDQLADELLIRRFGEDAPEVRAYRALQAWRSDRTLRQLVAHQALSDLYASDLPDAEKLERKAQILDALQRDLGWRRRPNNAHLVEVRVYSASYEGFADVHARCGGDLAAVIAAAKTIRREDFSQEVQEDLRPVLRKMGAACARAGSTGEKVAARATVCEGRESVQTPCAARSSRPARPSSCSARWGGRHPPRTSSSSPVRPSGRSPAATAAR